MKLFLLVYDRRRGEVESLIELRPGEYVAANEILIHEELVHPDMEVVLLEAPSEADLRVTHARYFDRWSIPIGEQAAS